jgi:RNA polymerase sigma-70 factor (ECF subfamily)
MSAQRTEAAFAKLVQSSSTRLYRLALRLTGGAADAEDVLQEAFLRAHLALEAGQFESRASLETWLYRVTTNVALDALRRARRRRRWLDLFHLASPETPERTEAGTLLREVSAWLALLPPEQHAALVLTQVEGLSNADAARCLDCSEGAIEQRLIRARAALRRQARQGSEQEG